MSASDDSDGAADDLATAVGAPAGRLPEAPPEEPMLADHPCARRTVDSLSANERHWVGQQFLNFYCESTRQSMRSKFGRFEAFCEARGVPAFPAAMPTVYAYVRHLREEVGGISVRSLPQYLAAISMVHQARGLLSWSCFDGVTRRLTGAWRRAVPDPAPKTVPVPAAVFAAILRCGLATDDLLVLRQCASACLDYVFMSRAESGHDVRRDDVLVFPGREIGFRERRTKLTRARQPGVRFRTSSLRGLPELGDLLLRWSSSRDAAWTAISEDAPPDHFWRLPGEARPRSATVSGWFSSLLETHPELAMDTPDLRHHSLRAGGASACFALEVPEKRIRAWGDWRGGGTFWDYIDVDRQPTEVDFRAFGWMTIRATDLHARLAHLFLPAPADA